MLTCQMTCKKMRFIQPPMRWTSFNWKKISLRTSRRNSIASTTQPGIVSLAKISGATSRTRRKTSSIFTCKIARFCCSNLVNCCNHEVTQRMLSEDHPNFVYSNA
ncbi:hypothetical protein EG68_03828 [Paragonimus skrjabini miyazakii]|uniref:Uncharacterized protein n=1 Tax=Paragonimus skrjabini miyazakii TaxID=59628 RepID=A0A8S9Z1R7_9TREM|nr:hypothetical protein EG68_03828 [Paragonimus skrjabini miyazakii]